MTVVKRLPLRRALLLSLSLVAGLMAFAPAKAAAPFCNIALNTAPNCYIAVDDGTIIATSVFVPAHCLPSSGEAFTGTCPTIFEMAGYENGSAEEQPNDYTTTGELARYLGQNPAAAPLAEGSGQLTNIFDNDYAVVHASVRGTGCSGGEFDLFSLRSALDGKQIIDDWIAKQDWSDGKVGIVGHSYSGITGTMVAEQQPLHLVANTVSGLIDDLYRGITYIGGVSNMGFPPLWTLGVRQAYDFLGGLGQGLARPVYRNVINPYSRTYDTQAQPAQCAANLATRGRTVINDPVVQGGLTDTDGTWWQIRSLITFIDRVNVPTWISGAYQDEQTGPRGPAHLWEQINNNLPKRLLLSNGAHGTNQAPFNMADRKAWMDHWMRGIDNGFGTLAEHAHSVNVYERVDKDGNPQGPVIHDTQFPLSTTQWTDYYFQKSNGLSTSGPSDGTDSYLSGSGRQSWFWEAGPSEGAPLTTKDLPDELVYFTPPLASNVVIAGPVTADLWISSTAPDTELFAQIIDVAPDGTRLYLQRGILKASHNAIDVAKSDCVDPSNGSARVACGTTGSLMYRPWRPHTSSTLTTPGTTNEYLVEIFPIGHVFRPGHRIMVAVMAPPRTDSYYAYVQKTAPAINTLSHDAAHPSRVTLPVIPGAAVGADPAPNGGCPSEHESMPRCVKSPNG